MEEMNRNEEGFVNEPEVKGENYGWYVVHTYSGYENKVKTDLEKTVIGRGLEKDIFEVRVPVETVTEVKNGEKKEVERRTCPCYVLVRMNRTPETWYVVRNTRGVTGFVGPNPSEPFPITDEEAMSLLNTPKADKVTIDCQVGDLVVATSGAWRDTEGRVTAVNSSKRPLPLWSTCLDVKLRLRSDSRKSKRKCKQPISCFTPWEGFPDYHLGGA